MMNRDQVFLESTLARAGAILSKTQTASVRRGKKRRSRFAATQNLHEGASAHDAAMRASAAEHERAFLANGGRLRADLAHVLQEEDGAVTMPSGWTATEGGAFSHPVHGVVHLQLGGRWTHRDKRGLIRKSGATRETLTGYLGDLGNANAADSLDDVLARVRGTAPQGSGRRARAGRGAPPAERSGSDERSPPSRGADEPARNRSSRGAPSGRVTPEGWTARRRVGLGLGGSACAPARGGRAR